MAKAKKSKAKPKFKPAWTKTSTPLRGVSGRAGPPSPRFAKRRITEVYLRGATGNRQRGGGRAAGG